MIVITANHLSLFLFFGALITYAFKNQNFDPSAPLSIICHFLFIVAWPKGLHYLFCFFFSFLCRKNNVWFCLISELHVFIWSSWASIITATSVLSKVHVTTSKKKKKSAWGRVGHNHGGFLDSFPRSWSLGLCLFVASGVCFDFVFFNFS